jgi:hypothetical protein
MNFDLNILWGLVFVVVILNIIIYLIEPLKYSEEKECIGLPCRQFTLFNQLLGYTFDICIIVVIAKMLGFNATAAIFIIAAFFGFLIYTSWVIAKPVIRDETLNPPPKMYMKKNARITIQILILLLDLLIFFLLFMIKTEGANNNSLMSGSGIFKNKGYGITNLLNTRFGGNADGNRFVFFCGWFAFLGIFQNIYNLYKCVGFHPTYYKLPLSW